MIITKFADYCAEKMKKYAFILAFVILNLSGFAEINTSRADKLFKNPASYKECEKELLTLLPQAANDREKCEVLWRLSRIYLVMGEQLTGKEQKQSIYNKGISYANQAKKADPRNPHSYMWHSANVGRECQTHSLMEQASAVPVMISDISMIVDTLNLTTYSEAWQAVAELYYHHPFKSTDFAINFARRSATTIPAGELRLSTFRFFAEMLYERNWSQSKRESEIQKNSEKFKKNYKTNLEKFGYYDGSLGDSYIPKWASSGLGKMSDRDEAKALVKYAMGLYSKAPVHTDIDVTDFNMLKALSEKWNN